MEPQASPRGMNVKPAACRLLRLMGDEGWDEAEIAGGQSTPAQPSLCSMLGWLAKSQTLLSSHFHVIGGFPYTYLRATSPFRPAFPLSIRPCAHATQSWLHDEHSTTGSGKGFSPWPFENWLLRKEPFLTHVLTGKDSQSALEAKRIFLV